MIDYGENGCPGWKKIEKLTIGGDDYSGLESKYSWIDFHDEFQKLHLIDNV